MKKYICICISIFFLTTVFAQTSLSFLNHLSTNSALSKDDTSSKTSTDNDLPFTSDSSDKKQDTDTNKQKTTIVPNAQLAMSSSDYLVTAGDIYTLAFVVDNKPIKYAVSVDTSYKIRVANITVLDASGKTFLQLKRLVEQIVTENYHLSGVQFVLTTPALFNITIDGEVQKTDITQAWALTRLSSVLSDSLTPYSSMRNITITSTSGKKSTYDLFKAERFGDFTQNPYLRPGDRVTVNRMSRKVQIKGAVERPGIYELLDGENLKELVDYYGNGLAELADTSRIELTRLIDKHELPGKKMYLTQNSINNDYPLVCYDSIFIASYIELKPVMFIEGALYLNTSKKDPTESTTPESSAHVAISFQSGENYAFLVRRNSSMFSAVSDIENAYIIRKGKDIPLDVSKILYDASYYSEESVQPYDTLMIPFKQSFVSVAGAVNTPGRYPYIPGRSWDYYIGLAGGFLTDKNFNQTVSIKDLHGKKMCKHDPITPETTITATTNSVTYYVTKYAPLATTILSIATTILTITTLVKN
jgi:polysaccharide biosynthesis/export protein